MSLYKKSLFEDCLSTMSFFLSKVYLIVLIFFIVWFDFVFFVIFFFLVFFFTFFGTIFFLLLLSFSFPYISLFWSIFLNIILSRDLKSIRIIIIAIIKFNNIIINYEKILLTPRNIFQKNLLCEQITKLKYNYQYYF